MIKQVNQGFILHTRKTTYAFRVMQSGHLEHLYYGRRIAVEDENTLEALREKRLFVPGNTNVYSPEFPELSLEDVCLEVSSYGRGDIREPFLEIVHEDGSNTSDFVFDRALMEHGKPEFHTLPVAAEFRSSGSLSAEGQSRSVSHRLHREIRCICNSGSDNARGARLPRLSPQGVQQRTNRPNPLNRQDSRR